MNNFPCRCNKTFLSLCLLVLINPLISGCSSMAKQFNQAFGDEFSGLSKLEAAMISHAVEDVRKQAPANRRSKDILHKPYKYEEKLSPPELALRGTAKSVIGSTRFDVQLMLDKNNYQHGKLLVTTEDRNETWKIIAFRTQGHYNAKQFEYTYLLTNQEGSIISLSILGTEFKKENTAYLAYEGILIVPEENLNWSQWKRAYTIDFGFNIPVKADFEVDLAEARDLSRDLSGKIGKMEQSQQQIQAKQTQIDTLVATMNKAADKAPIEKNIDTLTTEKNAISSELNQSKSDAEAMFIRLMETRERLSNNFALFTVSNRYTWLPKQDQSTFFSRWKGVDTIDKDIASFSDKLQKFIRIFTAIDAAMEQMKLTVIQNNNQAKDPMPKEAEAKSKG